MLVAGIDEAGRGPVVGDLVIAGVLIEESDWNKLVEMGVKDSKLLSPQKRQELYKEIKKVVLDYKVINVSPREIDAYLNSGTNLNELEMIKMVTITDYLKPDRVYIDAPSVNAKKFGEKFLSKIEKKCDVVAEHKADLNYAVVGAASILAKVTRDAEIERIKREIHKDIGSGYPGDEKTIKFVETAVSDKKFVNYIRTTWQTFKEMKSRKAQCSLAGFA